MVEVTASSFVQFLINNEMDNKKKMPQMKANRDKNKSQRISYKCINYLCLMQRKVPWGESHGYTDKILISPLNSKIFNVSLCA